MKTPFVLTIVGIAVVGGAAVVPEQAAAGTRDRAVNARQHHQTQRVRRGVRSGELTWHEAKQLRDERRDIRQLERAYKSDGTLTAAERNDLHQELNELGRDIRQEKHDAQQR